MLKSGRSSNIERNSRKKRTKTKRRLLKERRRGERERRAPLGEQTSTARGLDTGGHIDSHSACSSLVARTLEEEKCQG